PEPISNAPPSTTPPTQVQPVTMPTPVQPVTMAGSQQMAERHGLASTQVWDAESGEPLTLYLNHGSNGDDQYVEFSSDGRFLLSLSGTQALGDARVWEIGAQDWRYVALKNCPREDGFQFSADGNYVANGWDKAARIWDARTGS